MDQVERGQLLVDRMIGYAKKIIADIEGKKYGEPEKLACQRFLYDLERSKREDFDYYLDPYFVADVCEFAEKISHVDGNWDSPTIILHETQIFVLGNLIGWRLKSDWKRKRFVNAYLQYARKNAKSTLAAILGLYCLTKENELGAQIITAATKTEQALIVLHMMHRMANASKGMQRAFGLNLKKQNQISCRKVGGIAKALSSDAKTQDGLNPHLAILDEFHALDKKELFDVIRSAFGARKNALMLIITTAGHDLLSRCYAEYQMCLDLLRGKKQDDRYFVMIYTVDEDDDIFDPSVWRKANPLLGVSVQPEYMQTQALGARNTEANIAEFETKNLNRWRGGSATWLNMLKFSECANPDLLSDLNEHTANGGKVIIGVDLSSVWDMTSIAINWRDGQDRLRSIVYNFLPEGTINNVDLPYHNQYQAWVKQGYLQKIKGDRLSANDIKPFLFDLVKALNVLEVVFDFYSGSDQLAADIEMEFPEVVAFVMKKNAHNCSVATIDLEAQIHSGDFQHDGCPVLHWMASNAHVDRRVDGSLLVKKESKDSHNKIDGIDAIIQGNSRLLVCFERETVITDLGGFF